VFPIRTYLAACADAGAHLPVRNMIAAAVKALSQLPSPAFRAVLAKSIGLALVLITVLAVGLHRLLAWLAESGGFWLEGVLGPAAHTPLNIFLWMMTIAAGFGIVLGAIFLMPAVTALVASFFVDDIAGEVERAYYPNEPPGRPVPPARAFAEGAKTAGLAVLVYLCALPFLLLAGLGAIIFFLATAFLLGREYFELAAMRFRPPAEAKALRKRNAALVFGAGLLIAMFVSVPIVNLATPLFGTALMVHLHKRLSGTPLRRGQGFESP
jgi:CysZ protein